ncbi:MAG: molybdopterin-dependent oxidoreductase [Eggerthellaceae bacterium]|nr:molybdopterin-dependent oxidoreductase [Eggerthellaceae bacterium]
MSERIIQCEDGTVKMRTCAWSPPGDHPVGCGMYLTIKDGKVVKVEGDPEHPITGGRLCVRCLTLPEYMYNENRILHPMKRDPKDRGKDTWEVITWDQAADEIIAKWEDIISVYGREALLSFQGTGREATLYHSSLTFTVFGSPNTVFPMSGDSCYGPRCSVADFLLGAGYPEIDYGQFLRGHYDDPEYVVPNYIILWGKDPLFSNPDGFFGHSIIDLHKRGAKFITVDPRITWTACRAEYTLQLRPGTDAALGIGMLQVIINEDLYDHDFVENWCFGFEELKGRVNEYTLEQIEEITTVPKEDIIAAARAYATNKPSSILWGLAVDTNSNGTQVGHVIMSLIAITGNFDIPGGNTLSVPASFMGKWRYECVKEVEPEVRAKMIGLEKYPGFQAAHACAHPDMILDTLETGEPYPLKMAWFFGSNMLANTSVAQPKRWYEALRKLDLIVGQDIFMTPTAMALFDYFLPVATFAEHDGVVLPHFGRNTHMVSAMNKCVEVGDCKSDLEICFFFGKRVNPKLWPWESIADFFTEQMYPALKITFEDLQEEAWHYNPFEYKKYEKGLLRPDGDVGFNTPTGLIELCSSLYEDWGEDPLPYFKENALTHYSRPELAEEYPIILTTGSRETTSFHSEHRQIPSLRKIMPWPLVQIHPETAAKYGIADGDWVLIENPLGKAIEKAQVIEIVKPGVIHAQHGWWYPEQEGEEPNLFGVWKTSINSMIPHFAIGKLGFGAPYKNLICKISKVDGLDALGTLGPETELGAIGSDPSSRVAGKEA